MADSILLYSQKLNLDFLVDQWDLDKNLSELLFIDKVARGSNTYVWWKCFICGSSFRAQAGNATGKRNPLKCSSCSLQSLNFKTLAQFTEDNPKFKHLEDQWDYDRNSELGLIFSQVSKRSDAIAFWRCHQGHIWNRAISKRTKVVKGCPICANNKTVKGVNDLKTLCELNAASRDLLAEWDKEKNTVKIDEVSAGNKLTVHWKCRNGHSWKSSIYNRFTLKRGCPTCSGRIPEQGISDLVSLSQKDARISLILKEWNYEKNELENFHPKDFKPYSNRYVWWICEKGHEWHESVVLRFLNKYDCSVCFTRLPRTSIAENSLASFIQKLLPGESIVRSDRTIISPLELDIVIFNKKLAFEFNGTYWHRNDHLKGRWGSSEEYHRSKIALAKKEGFRLYMIWEDDWANNQESLQTAIRDILFKNNYSQPLLEVVSKG